MEAIRIIYSPVGMTHLLIHLSNQKLVDTWMLLDLEELARESGKSVDEVLSLLSKGVVHA